MIVLAASIAKRPPADHELTADELLEASLAAQGGRDRLEHPPEMTIQGTVVYPGAETASLTTWSGRIGDLRMVMTWPSGVDYRLDVHDDVVTVDQGAIGGMRDRRTLTGTERDQILIDAHGTRFASAKLVGITDYAGTLAYQITLTTAPGSIRTRYLSVATLLPVGEEYDTVAARPSWDPPGPPRREQVQFTFSDYRPVAGMLMAFQCEQTVTSDGHASTNTTYIAGIATTPLDPIARAGTSSSRSPREHRGDQRGRQ